MQELLFAAPGNTWYGIVIISMEVPFSELKRYMTTIRHKSITQGSMLKREEENLSYVINSDIKCIESKTYIGPTKIDFSVLEYSRNPILYGSVWKNEIPIENQLGLGI